MRLSHQARLQYKGMSRTLLWFTNWEGGFLLYRRRWITVVLFASAMAYVEAAVVAYLRVWLDRVDPYQPRPLMVPQWVESTEMLREAATLVMLATVGWLAGRTWRGRLGYFLVLFGVWDILYYVFLAALTGWPRSPLDWDVLFLIPVPWWGPVWSPISIASLMVVGGTLLTHTDGAPPRYWPRNISWMAAAIGVLLALYVFMAESLRVSGTGPSIHRMTLPTRFDWPLFLFAWFLLAAPILDAALQRFDVRPFDKAQGRRSKFRSRG